MLTIFIWTLHVYINAPVLLFFDIGISRADLTGDFLLTVDSKFILKKENESIKRIGRNSNHCVFDL